MPDKKNSAEVMNPVRGEYRNKNDEIVKKNSSGQRPPGVNKGKYDASMDAPDGTDDEMLERLKAGKFNSAEQLQ